MTSQPPHLVAEQTLCWFGHLLRLPDNTPAQILYNFEPTSSGWKHPRERSKCWWNDSLGQLLDQARILLSDADAHIKKADYAFENTPA